MRDEPAPTGDNRLHHNRRLRACSRSIRRSHIRPANPDSTGIGIGVPHVNRGDDQLGKLTFMSRAPLQLRRLILNKTPVPVSSPFLLTLHLQSPA